MGYDDAEVRQAYVDGARAALESVAPSLRSQDQAAALDWFRDLESWSGGAPPPAPHEWPDESAAWTSS